MMKLASFVFALLLIAGPVSALIITEVQTAGDQASQDYIIIHNPQEESLDLSGYSLKKKSSTGKTYSIRSFPRGTFIDGMGYLVWANSRDGFAQEMEAGLSSTATLSANNSIALFDSDGNILSALAWGTGSDQFGEGAPVANPEPNQQIKRRQNGLYSTTGSNFQDFYLSELPFSEMVSRQQSYRRYQPQSLAGPVLGAILVGLFSIKTLSIYLKS